MPRGALVIIVLMGLAGCETYTVEYHRRPAYYQRMSSVRLPDRVVRDDGTIVLYNKDETDPIAESVRFQPIQSGDDGTVRLRAITPEHVLSITLYCLEREYYDLLWDQVLADSTRLAYKEKGLGRDEFLAFCKGERIELARCLNRMISGINTHEVVMEAIDTQGGVRCRFWPQVVRKTKLRYRNVDIVREGFGLKLLLIS